MTTHSFFGLPVENSFANLPGSFYSLLPPQPLTDPRLFHVNESLASELGLSHQAVHSSSFLGVCSGKTPLPGGKSLSAVYSGHQFGVWAGQLGDGRAHLLGELITPVGPQELQLKGSGHTRYSRMGDGRAVLRSCVREYLASEAMAGLGIPTTRALALVVSDDPVYRETVESAAILARVAPTFVRFGSFEHWWNQPENMQILLDYVVDRFYPQCRHGSSTDPAARHETILAFLDVVISKTASLIADWLTVGFCHGVMNTDNMSVLGLTLDYGPYGFMDGFQANHICNHTDTQGRYAWNAQPSVANWNLHRLANCLMALGVPGEDLQARLAQFEPAFIQEYQSRMAAKLGLQQWLPDDNTLVDDWWGLLHTQHADFTLCFRRLAGVNDDPDTFLTLFTDTQAAQQWLHKYQQRLAKDSAPQPERVKKMNQVNPVYVLRNHLAEQAIRAAKEGDSTEISTLLTLLRDPCTEKPGFEAYAQQAPEWAQELSVSCSS